MPRRGLLATAAFAVTGSMLAVACGASGPREPETVLPADKTVVISELNYHDVSDDDANDFVELLNLSDEEADISGWCLRGIGFCFAEDSVIGPGGRIVVSGADLGGRLGNKGEQIILEDGDGDVQDAVAYGDSEPWPATADGDGDSLHRANAPEDATVPEGWSAGPPTPGEEAADDRVTPEAGVLLISEIHYHSASGDPSEEFVEVHNPGASPAALAGWCIPEIDRCFDEGEIPPGGHALIRGPRRKSLLDNGGQLLRLVDPSGDVVDVVRYDDAGAWPAAADGTGQSLQRRDLALRATSPANWVSERPTPGEANRGAGTGYLPTFGSVRHTSSPAPAAPLTVRARLTHGTGARLVYRIGFGAETTVDMDETASGVWIASIPGQAAGTLVRYRLEATSEPASGPVTGSWPRQGDGARYSGTVVASEPASELPRLQWFMADEDYSAFRKDKMLNGDTGYPAVFAHDGEIIDGALIRVKGQESRYRKKNKFKVTLPAGHEWDMGGLVEGPVDEFGLNSMLTDKSFSRDLLTYELQVASGAMSQQLFPLRLELNGEFFGVYLYQEQPDGRWRRKQGFSDDVVAIKGERVSTLRKAHLAREDIVLNRDYRRQTQKWDFHLDEVRWLIESVHGSKDEIVAFTYAHVDIPQVVNAMALARVAQHVELEHKNWMMFYDPADEKWRFHPIDHDLNFGKKWTRGCSARCDTIFAQPYMNYMQANQFTRIFITVPQFRAMLDRRTRTLADLYLAEGVVEAKLERYRQSMGPDYELDVEKWGQLGISQTMKEAQDLIVTNYLADKRKFYLDPDRKYRYLPTAQVAEPVLDVVESAGQVTITNPGETAVDVSGVALPTLRGEVPAGTVLLPGRSAVFSNARTPQPAGAGDVMHVHVRPGAPRG